MRVTATQYAKTLYDLTLDKSHHEINKVIANFIKVLIYDKRLKDAPQIITKFSEIYNKENNIIEAEVTSVNKLENSQIFSIENYLKEKYKAKDVVLKNKIDESIKGGIVVRVGDEVMDGSVAGQLKSLKNKLVR